MLLSICCSSRGASAAARLADRLERHLGIQTLLVQEDSAPVTETWEEGSAAGAILILLDSLTAPPPLRRESWTGLIDHDGVPPVAFARLEDCAYPKLIERRPFLPAEDPITLDRAVERWLVRLCPPLSGLAIAKFEAPFPERWWPALVDWTGDVTTGDPSAAQAFAHRAASHFQSVVWIGCAGREAALIRAEILHRVPDGRALVVLAHIDKPLKNPGGRHSYIQIIGHPPSREQDPALAVCYAPCFPGWFANELGANLDLTSAISLDANGHWYRGTSMGNPPVALRQKHLELLHRYFQHWKTEPELCRDLLAEIPAALEHGFANDWELALELCRRAAFLLLADGRRREGIRLLHRLLLAAEERGDRETADDARHELSWLTDGEDVAPRPAFVAGEQLALSLFNAPQEPLA